MIDLAYFSFTLCNSGRIICRQFSISNHMGHVEVNIFIMVYPQSFILMTSSVVPRAIVSLLEKFALQNLIGFGHL